MRAVWSFWSKPFHAYKVSSWGHPLQHMLAWGLSLQTARTHYPETVLITDTPGKRFLIDQLGLSFTQVSTELDRLKDVSMDWWAIGKLVAYSLQDRPFLHIDSDVFLWKPLPPYLETAPVVAQAPEHFDTNLDRFSPSMVEQAFAVHNLSIPIEWEWARSRDPFHFREENCGILGGCDTAFLRYFANLAIDFATNSKHEPAWNQLSRQNCAWLLEQFLLAACVDYHRSHPTSPYRGVSIKYLFNHWDQATNPNYSARVGFTHLLGGSKGHPAVVKRLEARLRREDPAFYRRCEALARNAT